MWDRITTLPFFVLLMAAGALAMLVPAAHGLAMDDFVAMRIFFYGTILFLTLTLLIALATAGYSPPSVARSQLVALVSAFLVLPLMLAVPFYEAVGNTTYINAWFEMVSCFTTTGATIYDNAGRLTPTLHLWRAMVGWLGGLLIWVAAVAVFAPMNLGGFEVRAENINATGARFKQFTKMADPSERLTRYALQLTPIYVALTFVLWLGLVILGDYPYVALSHAMSVMSSSGISPIGGLYYAASGVWGELLIFGFFAFAISRLTFSQGILGEKRDQLWRDPEVKTAAVLILGVTLLLFFRHFIAAIEQSEAAQAANVLQALWGALFTVTSFVTTTGFESRYWLSATDWSGLQVPGLVLMGLALIGGGVATTAGGVKLLRVYALFRHSERELERLVHPSSVGGGGRDERRIRKQGAYISWIFFMLFVISLAGVMVLMSLTGVQFETALILSVAAISNTGPLADFAGQHPIAYSGIPDIAKMILAATMVLGRLETLALVALFNPEIWRR